MEDRLIEIILTVCAIANPNNCEEKYLQFAWDGSLKSMHDGRAALYRPVDRPASCMGGKEMELRLSRQRKAENLTLLPASARQALRCCVTFGPIQANTGAAGFQFCRPSIGTEGNAPGQFSNLNGFDNPLARDIDDRDVIRDAIGDQQIFLVR